MGVRQFGSFYLDPEDVIAIETNPEGFVNEKEDRYLIHIRGVTGAVLLTGEAARKCFTAFFSRPQ